jgi:hypothetical protein
MISAILFDEDMAAQDPKHQDPLCLAIGISQHDLGHLLLAGKPILLDIKDQNLVVIVVAGESDAINREKYSSILQLYKDRNQL